MNFIKKLNEELKMKLNKKLIICTLLVLVMLFAISTVSAEESLNQNLTTTDNAGEINELPSLSDNSEKLSAEGERLMPGVVEIIRLFLKLLAPLMVEKQF